MEQLCRQMKRGGVTAGLEFLADYLLQEQRYHELFDTRLMQLRYRLGLPVILSHSVDELPEPTRSDLEDGYLVACREIGALFLSKDQPEEAWMYFRPTGEKGLVAEYLETCEIDEENLHARIELALGEGVHPCLGYGWVLEHYGTCNAITAFESQIKSLPLRDQQKAAAQLIRHVHGELLGNVLGDIERREGKAPEKVTLLSQLLPGRDELFADQAYHIDTTHLAATVRFAQLIEDRELLELARDLTEYGRCLDSQYHFAGESPFEDVYPTHALFFDAQLGLNIDEAIRYFQTKAQSCNIQEQGTAAIEVYVVLLTRLKRWEEAMNRIGDWIGPKRRTTGFAPSLWELAEKSGRYDLLQSIARERQDLLTFTAGLAQSMTMASNKDNETIA